MRRSRTDTSPKSQSSDASFMSAESGNGDIAESMSVGSDSLAAAAHEVASCNAEVRDHIAYFMIKRSLQWFIMY